MADCIRCAMYEYCADAPADGKCEGFITIDALRRRRKECCESCSEYDLNYSTCSLDPYGNIYSRFYICDNYNSG